MASNGESKKPPEWRDVKSTGISNSISHNSSMQAVNYPLNDVPNGDKSSINKNLRMEKPYNPAKYTKIQPAIAPKPVAVLPKPAFSPVVSNNNGKSISLQTSYSDSLINSSFKPSFNINTSKRWVLPPRPRPGRKPTTSVEEEAKSKKSDSTLVDPQAKKKLSMKSPPAVAAPPLKVESKIRPSPKKRVKVCKEEPEVKLEKGTELSPMVSAPQQAPQPMVKQEPASRHLDFQPKNPSDSRSHSSSLTQSHPPPPVLHKNPDPKVEINELKLSYLSKLKEQELIRNYIEVITSQIKELSFVQSGVITFDALKNTNTKVRKKAMQVNTGTVAGALVPGSGPGSSVIARGPHEQLESINNLNDLNKFVGYLSTSSNILHSVTKKVKPSELEDEDDGINTQIDHYLDIRSRFQTLKNEELKATRKQKHPISKRSVSNSIGIEKAGTEMKPSSILAQSGASTSNTAVEGNSVHFTPDLLKPVSFDQEMDDALILQVNNLPVISSENEPVNQSDDLLLMDDSEFIERLASIEENIDLVTEDSIKEQEELGKVELYELKGEAEMDVQARKIKEKKLNCGFCSNGTPCLCLDADLEMQFR